MVAGPTGLCFHTVQPLLLVYGPFDIPENLYFTNGFKKKYRFGTIMRDSTTDAGGKRGSNRRDVLRKTGALAGAASLSSIAGCTGVFGGGGDGGTDTMSIKTLGAEGALYIPVYFLARENDIWEKHGIDLSIEIAGFGKYTRAFTANLSNLTSFPTLSGATNINQGEDVAYVGSHMNIINPTFVRKDSDIQSITDLKGKNLGIPFESSTNTLTNKAMWDKIMGFDMMEDPAKTVAAAPPTLWNLLVNEKEIDAMIPFTGYAIKALANPDKVRPIFDPVEVWKEETGYPPPVTHVCATKSFVEENPQAVLNFKAAWNEAVNYFRDNIDTAITQYGRLAGLANDAEIQVVKDQVSQERVFPQLWSQEYIDSNWKLFEYVQAQGDLQSVPDKDSYSYTNSELENL